MWTCPGDLWTNLCKFQRGPHTNIPPNDNCKSFRFVMPGTPLAETRQLGNHVKETVQHRATAVENATPDETEDDSDAETRPLLGHYTRQFPPTRV